MSIADNIKFLRKQNNLTQKQLAEKSGLAVITIQQYEAGKYEPKKDSLYKLRKAFDCNIYEILDKPFETPDISMDDLEEIEGLDSVLVQKNLPPETKEKIIQQFLNNSTKISNKPLDLYENELLDNYRLLNEEGKKEANKRVEELTEISRYTKPDRPVFIHHSEISKYLKQLDEPINAAHADDYANAPEDQKQQEENIMDDVNF